MSKTDSLPLMVEELRLRRLRLIRRYHLFGEDVKGEETPPPPDPSHQSNHQSTSNESWKTRNIRRPPKPPKRKPTKTSNACEVVPHRTDEERRSVILMNRSNSPDSVSGSDVRSSSLDCVGKKEERRGQKNRSSSVQLYEPPARRRSLPPKAFPGLALGSSVLQSGGNMRFLLIANELHNQMKELQRVSFTFSFSKLSL